MTNINLKYLVIATILISILLVVGALIFSSFNKTKPTPSKSTTLLNKSGSSSESARITPPKPIGNGGGGGGGGGPAGNKK